MGDNGELKPEDRVDPKPEEGAEETRLVIQLFVNKSGQVFVKTTAQLSAKPVYLVDILTKALKSTVNTLMAQEVKPVIHMPNQGFINRMKGAFGRKRF